MDSHHIAHYGISAVFAVAIGLSSVALYKINDGLSPVYHVSASDLAKVPFGKHDFTIYGAPGSGRAPAAFADAVMAAGGRAKVEIDIAAHSGIWVAPDNDEGQAIAKAISKAIGEPVQVGNFADGERVYGSAFQIGVGAPAQK